MMFHKTFQFLLLNKLQSRKGWIPFFLTMDLAETTLSTLGLEPTSDPPTPQMK